MAKQRIRFDKFDRGLWLAGGPDTVPDGHTRYSHGTNGTPTGSLRSRPGLTKLYDLAAHSLFRFGDVRFQAAGTTLYRNGVSIDTLPSASRLIFVRMPPTSGKPDYLFAVSSGGNYQKKIDSSGNVTKWGIAAPPDGFTAAPGTQRSRVIDALDSAASWSAANATLADEGTIKQEGTNSMRMTVAANTVGEATKNITVDLSTYAGPVASPNEDFIAVWVRVDNPANLEFLQLQFSLGNTSFATDIFTRTIQASDQIPPSTQLVTQTVGIASTSELSEDEAAILEGGLGLSEDPETGSPLVVDPRSSTKTLDEMGQTTITTAVGEWVRLRIPKATFTRSGKGNVDWDDVQAVKLVAKTNGRGQVIVYWDDLRMIGGSGLQGRYRYKVTFRNSTTGSRSNANPNHVEINNVERQPVDLANLPTTADTQVDKVEIWRTVGNGVRFFKIGEVNEGTTTFQDTVADFAGLHSGGATLMTSEELPDDNDPPETGFHVVAGPFQSRVWWLSLDSGKRGRVYFSPAGRAEAVEDFLPITNDDDPLLTLVVWNGALYAFSESRCFQITGTGPFIAREVFGVPGVTQMFTAVPTPYGIVYEAADGIRAFNGMTSTLVSPEAVLPVFRGETVSLDPIAQTAGPFAGLLAVYARDEYFISDLNATLAVNLRTGAWRVIGLGFAAMYFEPDTGLVIVTYNNAVHIFEAEGVTTDAGAAIKLLVLTRSQVLDPQQVWMVRRIFADADVNGSTVPVRGVLDNASVGTISFTESVRTYKGTTINRLARRVGFHVDANVTTPVELFTFEAEVENIPLVLSLRRGVANIPAMVGGTWQDESTLAYDIDRTLELPQPLLIRRLIVDAGGASINPTLRFSDFTRTLATIPNTTRQVHEVGVNRVGNLVGLDMAATLASLELYSLTLEAEHIPLVLTLTRAGERGMLALDGLVFHDRIVYEADRSLDLPQRLITRRLFLDMNTNGATVTPTLTLVGETVTLPAVSTGSRQIVEIPVDRPGRFVRLELSLALATVELYGVEIDLYVGGSA